MKTYSFLKAVLVCAAALCSWEAALADSQESETAIAEELSRLGCEVHLIVTNGKVTVDAVQYSERLSEELFSRLKGLRQLRSLRLRVIWGQEDRVCLRHLASLSTLRHLDLFGKDVTDDVMPRICRLKRLKSLILWDVSVGESGLACLADLKVLKQLEFSSFRKISRRSIEAVAQLRNLESLRLYGRVEEGALRPLSALPKLETIWISGWQVNALLADLESVSSIRRIEIAGTDIDATTVGHLLEAVRKINK